MRIFNYFFTAVFIIESVCKVVALGVRRYIKDRWNQLDVAIVILSIVGIVLEEMKSDLIPINPTIIRVMRVLRIARGHIRSFSKTIQKRLRSFDLLPYSVETVEDGQRNPILAGHGDASPTASWQSRPFILLAVLHFCCSRSRIVWSTGY